MNTSMATGTDNVEPQLLQLASPYISDDITYICNQYINKSTFPRKWKEAKVSPLHNNEPHDDGNNYRPISILPVYQKSLRNMCMIVYQLS